MRIQTWPPPQDPSDHDLPAIIPPELPETIDRLEAMVETLTLQQLEGDFQ